MSKATTETSHDEGIVVSGKMKSSAFELTRRKILLLGLFILVIASVLALLCWQLGSKHSNQAAKQKPANSSIVSYQQRLSSEVTAAQQKLQADSKNPKISKSDVAMDYINLAHAYQNSHNYADAIAACEEALKDPGSKRQAYSCLMYAYAQNGQTDKAIATGNERIAYLKSLKASSTNEDPTIDRAIADTTDAIKQMQAGQPL